MGFNSGFKGLTGTLDKGERPASLPECFTSAGRILGNLSIEAWVASRLDVREREREKKREREEEEDKNLP